MKAHHPSVHDSALGRDRHDACLSLGSLQRDGRAAGLARPPARLLRDPDARAVGGTRGLAGLTHMRRTRS